MDVAIFTFLIASYRTEQHLGHDYEDICDFCAESISGSKRRNEQEKKRKPAPVESFAKCGLSPYNRSLTRKFL